jgi:predicted  nucleic acid-binding Zn-ribbon protein
MTVDEGFKNSKTKSPRDIAKEEAEKVRKEFKGADSTINKTINTNLTNLTKQIKAIPTPGPAGASAGEIKMLQNQIIDLTKSSAATKTSSAAASAAAAAAAAELKKLQTEIDTLKKNATTSTSATEIKTLQDKSIALTDDLKKNTDDLTKTTSVVNNAETQIKASEASVNSKSANITNQINAIQPQLANAEKAAQLVTSSSGEAITKIATSVSAVDKSVAANKQVSAEIDVKAKGIETQIGDVKKNVDEAKQQSIEIDKKLAEFQKSSALILAQMQLAVDNNNAAKLGVSAPPAKQGFQNMGISSIDTAYNGKLQLEGFSTVADSAYLNSSDLFALERNVVLALKEFNEAYYAYRKCLHDTPTISSSRCATELANLTSKKDAVITAVNAFNTASAAMNAKLASTSASTDNGKKISQAEFEKRHEDIKTTAQTVSELRAELDMKMANLLDKTKGPFPEAKNKYNAENYVTIGWSILATSVLYYVFVEMK